MKQILLAILLLAASAGAQSVPQSISGVWQGNATNGRGGVTPFQLTITENGGAVTAHFVNGDEKSPVYSGTYANGQLEIDFKDFANKLTATVTGEKLQGTFAGYARPLQISAYRGPAVSEPIPADTNAPPQVAGEWEIATKSSKGEVAWKMEVDERGAEASAVIVRVDGDTGRQYGAWDGKQFNLSRFTGEGASSYVLMPGADGTLIVSRGSGRGAPMTARRPQIARQDGLGAPDDPLTHTKMADANAPLAFAFPGLDGKVVSNTDAQFQGKVVLVTIGGSWCPNCHDEAPFLESLYKRFHAKGLEIIGLYFEEQTQLQNPDRLRAMMKEYGITFPILLAGETKELNAKLPGVDNLNCWPTTFYIGRDGKVQRIEAGFTGPAAPAEYKRETAATTAYVAQLLQKR